MSYYRIAPPPGDTDARRIGVLLVNLGTPAHPAYGAVWRYLREFLSDRRVIDSPRAFWLPLLYGIVLPLRSGRTAGKYRKVWMPEGSPLAVLSRRLADKLASRMASLHGDAVRVELAMTYGRPSIDEVLERMVRDGVRRLLVLPLYPQYCSSTTGSVLDRLGDALRRWRWVPELRFVNDYHAQAPYTTAIAEGIREQWRKTGRRSHLLLSFHGIPLQYVEQGDPYRQQCERTAAQVARELSLEEGEFTLCYQSRFGPVQWLTPYMADSLAALAARGVREVTVSSPSFAVDCLETLEEIGIQYRSAFERTGGRLELVPALNDSDAHASVLLSVISPHLAGWL